MLNFSSNWSQEIRYVDRKKTNKQTSKGKHSYQDIGQSSERDDQTTAGKIRLPLAPNWFKQVIMFIFLKNGQFTASFFVIFVFSIQI